MPDLTAEKAVISIKALLALFQLDVIVASLFADASTDNYVFASAETGITVDFTVYMPTEFDTPTYHEMLVGAICDSIEEGDFIAENVNCDSIMIKTGKFLVTKTPFGLLIYIFGIFTRDYHG